MAHALVLQAATANAACNAIVDLVDAGTPPGKIHLLNSIDTELGNVALNNPAFSASSGGVATLDVDPAITVPITVAGTLAYCVFKNAAGTEIWRGSIGITSDFDLQVSNTAVAIGDNVSVTSLTFTVPLS